MENQSASHDDMVMPFRVVKSGISGRLVRLGSVVDTVLSRHNYPEPVARVLGEALVIAAMLGAVLKFQSKLIIQTKTDGPVDFLVADYTAPGALRGYASFNPQRVADWETSGGGQDGLLIGSGHLAMTIEPGQDMSRYQGVVPLENDRLIEAAHTYFRQSEQLPTFAHVAVARHFERGAGDDERDWRWRAGGLIVQNMAREGGAEELDAEAQIEMEEKGRLIGEDDDDWERVRLLASTVEDHELLDPTLSSERLLYRLFHEEGVRVFDPLPLDVTCQCSRDRIVNIIAQFTSDELHDMVDDEGNVVVTCEFCKSAYKFAPDEVG